MSKCFSQYPIIKCTQYSGFRLTLIQCCSQCFIFRWVRYSFRMIDCGVAPVYSCVESVKIKGTCRIGTIKRLRICRHIIIHTSGSCCYNIRSCFTQSNSIFFTCPKAQWGITCIHDGIQPFFRIIISPFGSYITIIGFI